MYHCLVCSVLFAQLRLGNCPLVSPSLHLLTTYSQHIWSCLVARLYPELPAAKTIRDKDNISSDSFLANTEDCSAACSSDQPSKKTTDDNHNFPKRNNSYSGRPNVHRQSLQHVRLLTLFQISGLFVTSSPWTPKRASVFATYNYNSRSPSGS